MLRPVFLLLLLLLSACSSTTTNRPDNPENICDIFRQNEDWYDAAQEMQSRWKVPLTVSMAMMYQESSFRHDAKPPMDYFCLFRWAAVALRMAMHKSKMRRGTIIKRKLVTAGQIEMILLMRSILWAGIHIKPVSE